MPQATDLVVKNGAATPVDKTFVLISPAAGDGGVAEWALKEGTISSVFPQFTAMARTTGNQSRQLRLKVRLPSSYNDTVTGKTNVDTAAEFNGTFSIPSSYPEALKPDFVAYCTNLVNTALVKAMIKDAYPAT